MKTVMDHHLPGIWLRASRSGPRSSIVRLGGTRVISTSQLPRARTGDTLAPADRLTKEIELRPQIADDIAFGV